MATLLRSSHDVLARSFEHLQAENAFVRNCPSFQEIMDQQLAETLQFPEPISEEELRKYQEDEELLLALVLSASLADVFETDKGKEICTWEDDVPSVEELCALAEIKEEDDEVEFLNEESLYGLLLSYEKPLATEPDTTTSFTEYRGDVFDNDEYLFFRSERQRKRRHVTGHSRTRKHSRRHCTQHEIETVFQSAPKKIRSQASPYSEETLVELGLADGDTTGEQETSRLKRQQRKRKLPAQNGKHCFEKFRYDFYHSFSSVLEDPFFNSSTVRSRLVDVSSRVQNRFLDNLGKHPPTLAFHGTRVDNIEPICKNGFYLPGTHGVSVANGNVYGRGIYTSRTASYSSYYARGANKMLVCAVKDNAPNNSYQHHPARRVAPKRTPSTRSRQYKNKNYYHHKNVRNTRTTSKPPKPQNTHYLTNKYGSSSQVSCHSNIIVLFDPAYVCPLFVLDYDSTTPIDTNRPPRAWIAAARRLYCKRKQQNRTSGRAFRLP
eukprot:CAMPEP_0174262456 /NCGR_PEP_ID=MMETSP0439-20130205/12983_1 /TAXON_ID=0 /ORGANISM="Stereomyxa ramosa, Strain Chinc5" /LENGTH=492 /DNA_ID=CAMNT_0015347165 /DNA_START=48 /DNA_END=1522 /DNA_ORIENTATION=-